MEEIAKKWGELISFYKKTEEDKKMSFTTREMAKNKKEATIKCLKDLMDLYTNKK